VVVKWRFDDILHLASTNMLAGVVADTTTVSGGGH
jgi:hypothetical protein